VAATDEGPSLLAVDGAAVGVTRRRLKTMDLTRPLADITLDSVAADVVGIAGGAAPVVDAVRAGALAALAAECAGGAARCLAMSVADLPAALAAFAYCSDAYLRVATDTIQIHGGLGFTWEHDAHLFLKRATTNQVLFGDNDSVLLELATRIGV
jgi:alkylation response protein AidB-like acyl-CoA dehydrogenase